MPRWVVLSEEKLKKFFPTDSLEKVRSLGKLIPSEKKIIV